MEDNWSQDADEAMAVNCIKYKRSVKRKTYIPRERKEPIQFFIVPNIGQSFLFLLNHKPARLRKLTSFVSTESKWESFLTTSRLIWERSSKNN